MPNLVCFLLLANELYRQVSARWLAVRRDGAQLMYLSRRFVAAGSACVCAPVSPRNRAQVLDFV